MLIKMARDLGIFMIPGVFWLVLTSMETRIAASLLITIYVAVEVIRTVCAKEILAAQKWFPLITLAIIDGIGTYFLWSDIPKLYRYIKIWLILWRDGKWFARVGWKDARTAENGGRNTWPNCKGRRQKPWYFPWLEI